MAVNSSMIEQSTNYDFSISTNLQQTGTYDDRQSSFSMAVSSSMIEQLSDNSDSSNVNFRQNGIYIDDKYSSISLAVNSSM
jgi:hypothetical protein